MENIKLLSATSIFISLTVMYSLPCASEEVQEPVEAGIGNFLGGYLGGKGLDIFIELHEESYENLGYPPFYPLIPSETTPWHEQQIEQIEFEKFIRDLDTMPPDEFEKIEIKGNTG